MLLRFLPIVALRQKAWGQVRCENAHLENYYNDAFHERG